MIITSKFGRGRFRRFSRQAEWMIEKPNESDACPYAGKQSLSPDLARYCLINRQGGTCTTFRLKPFDSCPIYAVQKLDEKQLKIMSWIE